MLRLRLRVRKVEEAPDQAHVHIDAVLEAKTQDPTAEPIKQKERIVHIGPLTTDNDETSQEGERVARKAFAHVETILAEKGILLMSQKPPSDMVCLYITKQHFAYLGRPTVDDYIELNARTDREH